MNPPKDQAPGLIERLRDKRKTVAWFPLVAEAANMIEQLEAENAELRGKLEKAQDEAINSCAAYVNLTYGITALYNPIDRKRIKDTLTDQANIRSPVQNLVRDQYNPEDGA